MSIPMHARILEEVEEDYGRAPFAKKKFYFLDTERGHTVDDRYYRIRYRRCRHHDLAIHMSVSCGDEFGALVVEAKTEASVEEEVHPMFPNRATKVDGLESAIVVIREFLAAKEAVFQHAEARLRLPFLFALQGGSRADVATAISDEAVRICNAARAEKSAEPFDAVYRLKNGDDEYTMWFALDHDSVILRGEFHCSGKRTYHAFRVQDEELGNWYMDDSLTRPYLLECLRDDIHTSARVAGAAP